MCQLHPCVRGIVIQIVCIIFANLILGGIPGDHLIVPVSGHSVPRPMHLRMGQKDKVWSGEYVEEEEEENALGRIDAIDEEEEEHFLDGEERGEFEGKSWDNEEVEDEVEGDQAELEWEISEFPSKAIQHPHSQQHQYYGLQKKGEDVDVPGGDTVSRADKGDTVTSHLSRNRALRKLRRWQRLRSHGGFGFRLTQHWKSWRQRAQWVCSQGHRYNRQWQRYSLYSKQRRIKRYRQSPYTDGEDDSNDESFTVSEKGTDMQYMHF